MLIRSSMTRAVLPATSPTNRSPETTPALRCLSANALPTGRPQAASKRLAEQFCTLGAAGIRRNDAEVLVLELARIFHEQGSSRESDGATSKGVLEGDRIVHLERDDHVRAHGLEHAGDVSRRHRVVGLGAAVFAGVAQVRHDSRDARGTGVLERSDEEQQPAELVVGAQGGPAVQALDDIDILPEHRIERTRLVLAVLEVPLLMQRQWLPQGGCDGPPELSRCLHREQPQTITRARWHTVAGSP